MKKLFIAALFAVSFVTSAFAAETKVSSAIKSHFKNQFKSASDVTWSMVEDYTKASFVDNGVKTEAFFSSAGEIIGTSKGISFDQLSEKGKKNFLKKFRDYTITEAIRFEGVDEGAYYVAAKNAKESVVVKVDDTNALSIVKKTKF